MTRPLLVLGWGNRSRGDDALGPLLVERLRHELAGRDDIDFLDDYQLMIEHVLDLQGRERVLLVDASASGAAPFDASPLRPAVDASLGSHALSPQGLLHLAGQWPPGPPPPCTLLAIRGEAFELGAPPGPAALAHLDAALAWSRDWLAAKEDPRR